MAEIDSYIKFLQKCVANGWVTLTPKFAKDFAIETEKILVIKHSRESKSVNAVT